MPSDSVKLMNSHLVHVRSCVVLPVADSLRVESQGSRRAGGPTGCSATIQTCFSTLTPMWAGDSIMNGVRGERKEPSTLLGGMKCSTLGIVAVLPLHSAH